MKWRNELRRGQKVDFLNNKRLFVEANALIYILSNNAVIAVLVGIQGDNSIKSILKVWNSAPSKLGKLAFFWGIFL